MADSTAQAKKSAVLIIEDEPGIIDTLAYALGTEGFEVTSAGTGGGGLALFREHGAAIIILSLIHISEPTRPY